MLLVELKDNEGVLLPVPPEFVESESDRKTLAVLQRHYQLLLTSDVKSLTSPNNTYECIDPLMLRYQRKWTGDTGTGGRFYSHFVSIPKDKRPIITINNQSVGSWDFSQLHPTLLLLLKHGVKYEANMFSTGGIYSMPECPHIPRSGPKVLINTICNAKSKDAAARSIATARIWYDLFED